MSSLPTMAAAVQQQQLTIPVFTSKEEMRAFTRKLKLDGKKVGFVPTMVCPGPWLAVVKAVSKGLAAVGMQCQPPWTPGWCQLQLRYCILCRGTCTKATCHW
jgi:hypothetical protein